MKGMPGKIQLRCPMNRTIWNVRVIVELIIEKIIQINILLHTLFKTGTACMHPSDTAGGVTCLKQSRVGGVWREELDSRDPC
jgi:hypothetical protein